MLMYLPSQWLSPMGKWAGEGTAGKRMQEEPGGMLTSQSYGEVLTDEPWSSCWEVLTTVLPGFHCLLSLSPLC